MTITVNENTFEGPNQGNTEGYIPETIIESAKMDADMNQIKADLDKLLAATQALATFVNQIDLNTLGNETAKEIVDTINASTEKIDSNNLASDVVTDSELNTAIETHRVTTSYSKMHPETSIRSTELGYSVTPTTLITSCANLLDEIKNLRYQIKRINGKTNWSDTPDSNITSLYTSINSILSELNSHIANMTMHINVCQNAALDGANGPCANNVFATMKDLEAKGYGDMLRAVYDKNKNGYVDSATALHCACGDKTYSDIVSVIATDITAHKNVSDAHHSRYTNSEAIGAINNDADHSSTAKHYYGDLLNKPPSNAFLTSEVTNVKANKLANGTTPWSNVISKDSDGYIPATNLPIEVINTSWVEPTSTLAVNSYFSTSVSGEVSATFTGPCLIYNGFGVVTQSYSYLQYSVNGGTVWKDCSVSDAILRSPSAYGDNLSVWQCLPIYIPSGVTFKVRAGSTYNGSSNSIDYGAGFNIRYKQY